MDTKVLAYTNRPWQLLVGGDLHPAQNGATMPVIHPGDESVIASIPLGGAQDVDDAVAAAQAASKHWARASPVAPWLSMLSASSPARSDFCSSGGPAAGRGSASGHQGSAHQGSAYQGRAHQGSAR